MSYSLEQGVISPAPHIYSRNTIGESMRDVLIALVPITLVSIYIFGLGGLLVIFLCVGGALLGEVFARKIKKREASLFDGVSLVTGLLLALTLPPTAWWAMVPLYGMGGFMATFLFRENMGGLGMNRFNPALMSRLFLLAGRTTLVYMAPFLLSINSSFEPWLDELGAIDAMSKATPLMKMAAGAPMPSYISYLFPFEGGCLGETSVLALLIGAAYLLIKGHINWSIPVPIISTVFILTAIFGSDPVYHVLSGGLLLGALFMATDWVTSPITNKGRVIYGVGIGAIVVFFRLFMAQYWLPLGGVLFAILIMNGFVPLIDKFTKRKIFGEIDKSQLSAVNSPNYKVSK